MTERVALFAIRYVVNSEPRLTDDGLIPDGRLREILKPMLDDQMAQNDGFTELLSQLHLDEDNCCETLCNVFTQMLSDGVLNWGRVVTIFCFSGCAARHLADRGFASDLTGRIAETCAEFVASWIEEQGGWEKFGDQFEEQKSETMNWTGWHDLVCKGIMAVSSAVSVR